MVKLGRHDQKHGVTGGNGTASSKMRAQVTRTILVLILVLIIVSFSTMLMTSTQVAMVGTRKVTIYRKELWMSDGEAQVLIKHMKGVRTYLEWGSGGSTLNIAPLASEMAVTIEHDEEWCQLIRNKIIFRNYSNLITLYCAPTQHKSGTDGSYAEFREYIDTIDKIGQQTWDFVFVDGRARVSAAIKALSYITPDTFVALHDFNRVYWTDDNTYSPVLHFYDIIAHVPGEQALGVLRRKPRFHRLQGDHAAVQRILNRGVDIYKLDDNTHPIRT